MAGHSIGTIFAELDLDASRYIKSQQQLLKSATSTTLNIEQNFKNLGIKSSAEMDLMRAKITNSYNMIANSSKATANDILRAEKSKNEQLSKLDEMQFGKQTTFIENIKKNWIAYSAIVLASFYAVKKAVDLSMEFIKTASDLNETISKSNAVFKDNGKEILDWSKTSATAFGMSRREALENAATIGNMFDQLGAGTDVAAKNSKQMIKLSADIASFHNVTGGAETVLNAMMSAFRGEYDALQRYIPTIKAASVQQLALAETGKKSASDLTELEKATAAMHIIMKDAGAATGDFARTSGEAANQERILKAQIEDVKAAIGTALLPAHKNILTSVNDWITANDTLLKQDLPTYIGYIGKAVSGLAKGIENMMIAYGVGGRNELLKERMSILEKLTGAETSYNNAVKHNNILMIEVYKRQKADLQEQFKLNNQKIKDLHKEKEVVEDLSTATQESAKEEIKSQEKVQDKWKEMQGTVTRVSSSIVGDIRGQTNALTDLQNSLRTDYLIEETKDWENTLIPFLEKQTMLYGKVADSLNQDVINAAAKAGAALGGAFELSEAKALGFFDYVKEGLDKSKADWHGWAKEIPDMVYTMSNQAKNTLSDVLFDAITGDLKDFSDYWDSIWKSMARTVTDKVADMAVSTAIDWVESIFAAEGIWKVDEKGAGKKGKGTDTIPAMLSPGEMVIPSREAEAIRDYVAATSGGQNNWSALIGSLGSTQQAFLSGTASKFSKTGIMGIGMMAQGKIGMSDLVSGLPHALALSAITSGIPAAIADMTGAGLIDQAGWGSKILGSIGFAQAGIIGGTVGKILGNELGFMVADALNIRTAKGLAVEATLDILEREYGGVLGRISGSMLTDAVAAAQYRAMADILDVSYGGYGPTAAGGAAAGGAAGLGALSYDGYTGGSYAGYGGIDYGDYGDYGYEKGTGLPGLPRTGWFYGHAGEIIANPEQSREIRKSTKEGGSNTINVDAMVKINGALIADENDFNQFVEKIDKRLHKLSKWGH